ncbi:hypothetical protein BLJAPNOD_02364 [Ensifer sp. M14]|uniref:hypothetical protein n=1 Tax=Sinorhizobium/Ensifer group TaxID=227292 RepID=UPI0009864728|nr:MULTISPECIES: hypothetical protein [Sinorhizobium/Ensifer group]OOG65856.1 hypothetical protein B0E45_26435 [Sinorhizobium sp. A49]RDL51232.1 hypothetical protein BLJAPNOD_02364 [Ensifer sp. M14]
MSDAATNSPFVGEGDSGRAALTIDDAANVDFAEPGEANAQEEEDGQSTNAPYETTVDGQEAGETVDNTEGDEPAGAENGDAASQIITLKGGDQVPLSELKLGYMRERDYRHKTQETANKGRALEGMTTRVVNTVKGIASYLAERLPPEPPRSLAYQDPAAYTRQKAMYDDGLANINQIIELANDSSAVAGELASTATEETLQTESERLAQVFPQTTKEDGRKAFFDQAFTAARELGFSDQELKGVSDHRLFGLAYYAQIGMKAEQARHKALTKVTAAPPATPNPRPNGGANQQIRQNKEALQRLSKTGSMKDAMSIDFD